MSEENKPFHKLLVNELKVSESHIKKFVSSAPRITAVAERNLCLGVLAEGDYPNREDIVWVLDQIKEIYTEFYPDEILNVYTDAIETLSAR